MRGVSSGGGGAVVVGHLLFLLPLKALFAILVSTSKKGVNRGEEKCACGGRGVTIRRKGATSVFARCSFCYPYLALTHGR